ncbi:GSCOCG00005384001-RA-CDS, partial [Cotesia congregata]
EKFLNQENNFEEFHCLESKRQVLRSSKIHLIQKNFSLKSGDKVLQNFFFHSSQIFIRVERERVGETGYSKHIVKKFFFFQKLLKCLNSSFNVIFRDLRRKKI